VSPLPERPAHHHGLRLCLTHHNRWKKGSRRCPDLDFEICLATQTESFPGYGDCLVVPCPSLSHSPMGLCWAHETRYESEGRPGGARRP
jgi:hypothetical protein